MNNFSVFLYGILFAATTGAAFAFMWRSMGMVRDEFEKPRRSKLPAPHPEMEGVKYGEELLVFKSEENDDNT